MSFGKQALEEAAAGKTSGAFISSGVADPAIAGSWKVKETLNLVTYLVSAHWEISGPGQVTLSDIQHTILDDTTWKPYGYEPVQGQQGHVWPDWPGIVLTALAIAYYGEDEGALFQQFSTIIQWSSPPMIYDKLSGKLNDTKPKVWPCH